MDLPRYDELPFLPGLDVRHAWGLFGEDDAVGTVNQVTSARIAAAATEIRTGELFPLDLPLDLPDPPMFGRGAYTHHIGTLNRHEMDDHLDGFHPQASTQWDALSHVRAREHGFWGGRTTNPTDGPNELGIDHVARHGIAGRGILIDVGAYLAAHDPTYHPLTPYAITADHVRATLAAQRVTPEPGDIWCLRTGWIEAYRRLDRAGREALADQARSAGLVGDHDVTRLVWDSQLAALCADNPGVEVAPGDPAIGSLHRRLIPALGVTLGEFFDLDRLAAACHADGRFTFFFVAAPLHLPGGIGSTGNATAIR